MKPCIPPKLSLPRLGYLKRSWWKIFALSLLIAIGVALWPTAQCAVGQCGPREQWCKDDCSMTCAPASRYNQVRTCRRQEPFSPGRCLATWNHPQYFCPNDGDCSGGTVNTYECTFTACEKVDNYVEVDCCLNGPPPCTPNFAPPTIDLSNITIIPPYPLTISQDPDRLGVTIAGVTATGGREIGCNTGQVANITGFFVSARLTPATIQWIEGELRERYPGAYVHGTYPIRPDIFADGLGTPTATLLPIHFENPDPGEYIVEITAYQSDGKATVVEYRFVSALLEATLSTWP